MADYTGKTWADADARLGKRASLNIGWHTKLLRYDNGRIAVRYHDTDVVTYLPDGRVELRTGGWKSQTTKRRMEDYSAAYVWSDNGIWYVKPRSEGSPWSGNGTSYLFAEGVILHPDGTVTRAGTASDKLLELEYRAKVKKYARRYFEKLKAGKMGGPGAGDCLMCQLERSNPDKTMDADHVMSHVREGYLVPSLIWAAMLGSMSCSEWEKAWVATRMQRTDTDSAPHFLERRFRNWLYRRLGLHA